MLRGDGRTRISDFAFTLDGTSIIASYCRGMCYASTWLRWAVFPTGNDPVRIWDVASGRLVWEHVYDAKNIIDRIVPSPDGDRFASVSAHAGVCAIGMNKLSDGRTLWIHPYGPCADPPSIIFSANGRSFISNRVEEANHKNKLWSKAATYESSTGKMVADFTQKSTIRNADISSDGRWLASTIWKGLLFEIWDLSSNNSIFMKYPKEWKWRGPRMDRIRFSPDGRWLVVGNNETGSLAIYEFGPSWSK